MDSFLDKWTSDDVDPYVTLVFQLNSGNEYSVYQDSWDLYTFDGENPKWGKCAHYNQILQMIDDTNDHLVFIRIHDEFGSVIDRYSIR